MMHDTAEVCISLPWKKRHHRETALLAAQEISRATGGAANLNQAGNCISSDSVMNRTCREQWLLRSWQLWNRGGTLPHLLASAWCSAGQCRHLVRSMGRKWRWNKRGKQKVRRWGKMKEVRGCGVLGWGAEENKGCEAVRLKMDIGKLLRWLGGS